MLNFWNLKGSLFHGFFLQCRQVHRRNESDEQVSQNSIPPYHFLKLFNNKNSGRLFMQIENGNKL